MTAPAGSAAAFREARRGKSPVGLTRAASLANMKALIAAGEAGMRGSDDEASPGVASMKRELAKLGERA